MKQQNHYMVGGHLFSITITRELLEELKLSAYEPFKVSGTETEQEKLFDIEIVDTLDEQAIEPLIVDAPQSSEGMPKVDIYRTQSGFLYNIVMPWCNDINASFTVDNAQRKVRVVLDGKATTKLMALNNSVILSYISFATEHSTLLLHASTVMLEGKAYLFLGKSGTGKSTHSRMWLEAFAEAELLNDDHPIVRSFDDGSITVYGSPWSGKTHCYRNLSAPLGAIVRISRALENRLEELRPLKAFASITTSCSGAQWSQPLIEAKVKAIETIVKRSKGYTMHCLPNTHAAEVCHEGLTKNN